MEQITFLCFGASYSVALLAELVGLLRPTHFWRWLSLGFGLAGFAAHSMYLIAQSPTPATPYGSLLLLGWVLAVFYLYGTVHHRRIAWAVFVLPVVLGLVVLASGFAPGTKTIAPSWLSHFVGDRFWGAVHGALLLLAAVGVCVGAIASVMYLAQARRLRAKTSPQSGIRLLSLERLETMNRRSIALAFPLLTVGLIVGLVIGLQRTGAAGPWASTKVISTAGLWLVNALLLGLRFSVRARGRLLAIGTIGAFLVMLLTLLATHPFAEGAES